MKKLLFVFTLSSLFVCCNNGKETPSKVKEFAGQVPHLPDSTHTSWDSTLIDTTLAKTYTALLDSFVNGILVNDKKADTPTKAFVIDANALLHAVTDSPNITHVIFYLGKYSDTSNKLNLMYLPARAVYQQGNPKPIDYNEVLFGNLVFDQSVPCPTCDMKGPISPLKYK